MKICPFCGGRIRDRKWIAHEASHRQSAARNLREEIPPQVRSIDSEMPASIFRNLQIKAKGTGILLKNQQGLLFDGVTVEGAKYPIVDEKGRRNVFRRIRRIR